MDARPAVIVLTPAQVAAAAALPAPYLMLTARGAAGRLGPQLLRSIMPDTAVIDCGGDPGLAWRAVEVGWTAIFYHGPNLDKLVTMAATAKITVFTPETLMIRLDLSQARDPERSVREFLREVNH